MKLLLHICCAPCTIYPLKVLRSQRMEVHGFFYNPNIHPYQEFQRRLMTLEEFAPTVSLPLLVHKAYEMEEFLRLVVFRETERCRFCYAMRLKAAALAAKEGNFEAFTATLLYSRFQKHEAIKEIGQQIGREVGVPFYYSDFRPGWQEGIGESKRLGLYRQKYCGCIYSEKERFCKGKID
ncbi:MAG TPA: epoxyqueuosine reductase QueH [Thermodesulfobacteriota bacterium]|nr:epoxyqueuosine reductase QueH [Thermodesulfobacteriota bacterium]